MASIKIELEVGQVHEDLTLLQFEVEQRWSKKVWHHLVRCSCGVEFLLCTKEFFKKTACKQCSIKKRSQIMSILAKESG